jgi:hypothetical protein
MAGGDLDIPGSELDDAMEAMEEAKMKSNYYWWDNIMI